MTSRVINATEMEEGDGARVKRLFPVAGCRNIDPFVLFDEFFVVPPAGFPPHPHRGFEAITYMFEGSFQHEDNLGNSSTVDAGGAQRFTAGRGLVHSEMPRGDKVSHGIQLWINLSRAKKQIDPAYQQVNTDEFPENDADGIKIRTLVGNDSPLLLETPVSYLDVQFHKTASTTLPVKNHAFAMIYVVEGELEVNGQKLFPGQALQVEKVDRLSVSARSAARAMYLAASPHGGPIIQHGPFVD